MSTWCYFQCLDHNPPLIADLEFTQHVGDLYWNRAVDLIDQRPVSLNENVGENDPAADYFERNARRFLHAHPTCRIGIVDEYGRQHEPIKETP